MLDLYTFSASVDVVKQFFICILIEFWMLNQSSMPRINSTWLWCIILFIHCCVCFANTFLMYLLLFRHQAISSSFWLHGLQHSRLPCPPLSPAVCSNSCSLSRWCYLTISPSVALFSSCPQSFPASVSSSNQVVKVLELQLQHRFFRWISRTDFL